MNQNALAAAAGSSFGRLESDPGSDSEDEAGSKHGSKAGGEPGGDSEGESWGEPGGEFWQAWDPLSDLPGPLVHSNWSPPSEGRFVAYSELFLAEVLVELEED